MIRALFFMLCCLSFTRVATAADAADRAKAAVKEASAAYKKKDFSRAAEKYVEAHEILERAGAKQKPQLLYNAGLAYDRAGTCARAVVYYERYADALRGRLPADVAARLERARRCAPEIAIQTTPPGAAVRIDGVAAGTSPLTIHLAAGGHRIEVSLEGYASAREDVAIEVGRPKALAMTLKRLAIPTRLSIRVTEAGDVRLDGSSIGTGPLERVVDVADGPHTVELTATGCAPRTQAVAAVADRTTSVTIDASCSPVVEPPLTVAAPQETEGPDVLPWVIGGAGGVALVTGGVFVGLAASDRAELDRELDKSPARRDGELIRSLNADIKRNNVITGVAVGVGVAAIGTVAYLLLTDEPATTAWRRIGDPTVFVW